MAFPFDAERELEATRRKPAGAVAVDPDAPIECTPENVARVLDEMASGRRTSAVLTVHITREALERVRPGPGAFVAWAEKLQRAGVFSSPPPRTAL